MNKFVLLLLFLVLTSCSFPSKKEANPAKIGYGSDDMKKSRCADNSCKVFYKNGEFI